MWLCWRAIRDRGDPARFAGPVFRVLATAMTLAGIFYASVGIRLANPMTFGFALIGLVFGMAMWRFALRGPPGPRWWIGWHLNGVCLLFAATHDSFFSLGLRRLVPELQGDGMRHLVFYSVLALAIGARLWLGRKYLAHGGRAPGRQSRASAATNPA
jgi:hypothetical protein